MVLEYENSVFEDYRIDIKALQKIIKEIPNGKVEASQKYNLKCTNMHLTVSF